MNIRIDTFTPLNRFLFGLCLITTLSLVAIPPAMAEVKIATVDIGRILNESPEAKNERAKLDAASAEAKKKVEARGKSIKDLETKIKAQNLPEDSPEVQDFREKAKDFARFVKDTEEEFKKKFIKANNALTEKALEEVRAYAKSKGIELVLDKSSQQRGPVLFGGEQIDITSDIVKRLKDG